MGHEGEMKSEQTKLKGGQKGRAYRGVLKKKRKGKHSVCVLPVLKVERKMSRVFRGDAST